MHIFLKLRGKSTDLVNRVQGLRQNGDPDNILRDSRSLTRFLCGVTSPRTSRCRLSGHALFGVLDRVPFKQVLGWVESHQSLTNN